MPEESTTPGLIERTRFTYEAVTRGDLDAAMSDFAPNVVWEIASGIRFEGFAAARGFLEDWIANLDDWRIELEELHDFGNGVILAAYRQTGRPGGSTFSVQEHAANMYEWAEGAIVLIRHYTDIAEARTAAERLAEERG